MAGGFGGGVPFDEERVRDWLDESSSFADFIAVDEDEVPLGICTFSPHWRDPEAAYVGLLGVIQRAKGKKVGKHLLLRSIEKAIQEGIKRVDLHTWSGNLNAMPLYKKVGMFWVPDTTVYMQDYIPLLYQNDLTKEWFERHEDWYSYQKRELKQEPDDINVEDMKIYRYRFEDEDDWMEVDIDRYGWGITGIHRKLGDDEFVIKSKVDSHDIYIGIENRYVLEIKNDTDEEKEIELEIDSFQGLEFIEECPSTVKVDKGETKTISCEFLVNNKAETFESTHKASETINTIFKIDDKEFTLTTGGKIKPAVEIDGSRDLYYLFSGKEKEIFFDLKNHTDKVLNGEIAFKLDGKERIKEFSLEEKENSGISLPVKLDFEDENVELIELTPSIEKEPKLFPMKTYKHPLVNDVDDLLGFAEKKDEVYLVNNGLKVKAELEGGSVTVSERFRDSELPFELNQQVGPPFGQTQDRTLRYDHEVVKDKMGLHLILQAESIHKPGIVIKKHVRIKKHSSEVEFWSELENVSESSIKVASETNTRRWEVEMEPYQSKAKIYTPLGDEVIESDPVTDMLSGTLIPTDPEKWKETWTAYEDIADGAVSGLMWNNKNIKKVQLVTGLLNELKSITKKLEPGESFKSTHLWISVKKSSLTSFRDTWNRLVGKNELHPNERVYGKRPRKHIEARLDHNILRTGKELKRKIIIDKAVDYPMPGEYSIKFPEYMEGSFSNGKDKIEISKEEDEKELQLPIDVEVIEEKPYFVDDLLIHFSGERELDFELPVIMMSDDEVKVEDDTLEGGECCTWITGRSISTYWTDLEET